MAWESAVFDLLDDLEQQAEAAFHAERGAELEDRARSEYAEVPLAGRLMASVGRDLVVGLPGLGAVAGHLDRVGAGWLLLRGPAQDWVVPQAALGAVEGLSDRALPEVAWPRLARLGLRSPLRRLADARERCLLHLRDGSRHDGRLGRVGQDFVEVVVGPGRVLVVPLDALVAVQSRD